MKPNDDRKPPEKIRITKLQEAQVQELGKIEAGVADMFQAIGVSQEPRSDMQIVQLTRRHDVLVAEADDHVAGYLAWADEAPGIAHLVLLMVAPDFQRFGIGTRLLRALGESASSHGIETVVTPVWEKATWSMAFLGVRGFSPLNGAPPEKLTMWREEREPEVVQSGQRLWWSKTDGLGTIPGLPRPR